MPPKKKTTFDPGPLPPPATTLEGREQQLIALATDLAEHRLASGEASAQEVVHFLRLGSVTAQLQNEKLRSENDVLKTRVKEMESRTSSEGLYAAALRAFRGYSGAEPFEEDEDENPDLY